MALNYVHVTGTFDDGSGNPLSGSAVFTPSQTVYASGVPVVSTNNPVGVQISNGSLGTVQLLATDNSGLSFTSETGFFFWTVTVTLGNQAQSSFSFFLPHTPTTVDLYSLANTAAGSSGFQNPMTTLGDLIYENATLAAARLAGPTSGSLPYVLTSTPSGGVAQAPAWSSTFDQPWIFRPESYGAKGDGKVVGDVVTNSTTTITSATASFTQADVGKYVMINGGAGTTSPPLVSTIQSVTNGTTAVLNNAATASQTGCAMVWGTDDTAAINSAVTAAGAYGNANAYFAEVLFGAKVYMLATGPTQVGNGSSTPTFNSQIPLPYANANGLTQKLVISLKGAGDNGYQSYWGSTAPNLAGTTLVSTLSTGNTPNGTFGQQSVIGGPTGGAGFNGGSINFNFANVKPVITGIQVCLGAYTNIYAFDFGYCTSMAIRQSMAQIFAVQGLDTGNIAAQPLMKSLPGTFGFQQSVGVGLRAPVTGNNADSTAIDFTVMGFARGVMPFDHFTADRLFVMYADRGLYIDGTAGYSNVMHRITIANFGCEQSSTPLQTNGGGGTIVPVNINMDTENGAVGIGQDVTDAGNVLFGIIRWTAPSESRSPIISGGGSMQFINDKLTPGHMSSPPSVPGSGSASTPVYREGSVVMHTGAGVTVSAIAINGTTTGLTMAASSSLALPPIPSGATITPTYAGGTPTWDWWLI